MTSLSDIPSDTVTPAIVPNDSVSSSNNTNNNDDVSRNSESRSSSEGRLPIKTVTTHTNNTTHTSNSHSQDNVDNITNVLQQTHIENNEHTIQQVNDAEQQQTLSQDNENSPEHPLKSSWTLWINVPNQRSNSWMESMQKVLTFSTVEEFWRLFNNIKIPSQLAKKSHYYLFRTGINPEWEDIANRKGGRWRVETSDTRRMDFFWMQAVLATIGSSYEHSQTVTGIVSGNRPREQRLDIWTDDFANEEACLGVGKTLWEVGRCGEPMDYMSHEEAAKKVVGRNIKKKALYSYFGSD